MQRTHTAPRPAEEAALPPLEAAPPLRSLLEEVRSPGASRVDVDALLRALSAPPGPQESPRERADLLLEVLGDSRLRDVTGSDERPLHAAALEALLALGFPYALEVPPELFSKLRPKRGTLSAPAFTVGLVLPALVTLVQGAIAIEQDSRSAPGVSDLELILLVLVGCFTVLPVALAAAGAAWRIRPLNLIGNGLQALVGLGWLLLFFSLQDQHFSLDMLALPAFGVAHLASAVCLHLSKSED